MQNVAYLEKLYVIKILHYYSHVIILKSFYINQLFQKSVLKLKVFLALRNNGLLLYNYY